MLINDSINHSKRIHVVQCICRSLVNRTRIVATTRLSAHVNYWQCQKVLKYVKSYKCQQAQQTYEWVPDWRNFRSFHWQC